MIKIICFYFSNICKKINFAIFHLTGKLYNKFLFYKKKLIINKSKLKYKFIILILLLFFNLQNLYNIINQLLLGNIGSDNNISYEIVKSFTNITTFYTINSKVKIAIYSNSLSNGGVERNTALLINYLSTIKIFELYLFTDLIAEKEYKISDNIKRVIISYKLKNLKKNLLKYKIKIFIYQSYQISLIKMIKKIKNLNIILYNHSCFLLWIYSQHKTIFKEIYNEYRISKYVISIVPFENYYLFKKWGINSIFMNNFLTYDYNKVIQSDLSANKILIVGRGDDIYKRFDLGINSMKFIINEISDAEMIIISNSNNLINLKGLVKELHLDNQIKFVGYTSTPEVYFKDASLNFFPAIAEACPMVLSETKIYGIPNILVGIDYVTYSKEGVVIIYDDNPE